MNTLLGVDQAHILSIDPGGTTGIAYQLVAPHGQSLTHTENNDTPEALYNLVLEYKWDVVLCERFATSGRLSKYGIYTIQLVGGVHALCYTQGIQFIYRSPQNRKAFQDAAKAWFKGARHVEHEEDALAHLLAWKYFQQKQSELGVDATSS